MLGFRKRIRLKLTAFVAVLVFVVVVALTVTADWMARSMLRAEIRSALQTQASEKRHRLLAFIGRQEERLALVASRTQLRRHLDTFARDGQTEEELQANVRRILADARLSTTPAKTPTTYSGGEFLTISLADLDGRVIASSGEAAIGAADVSERPAFQQVRESIEAGERKHVVGLPEWSSSAQRFVIHLAGTVETPEERDFILVVELDATRLMNIASLPSHTEDESELVVGSLRKGEVRVLAPLEHRGRRLVFPPGDLPILGRGLQGKLSAGHGLMETADHRGKLVLATYRPVGYQDWGMVAKVDIDKAYAPLSRLRLFVFGLGGGLLLAGLVGSYLLSRRVTRPIVELSQKASTLAAGKFDAQVAVTSSDEVGSLQTAFNRMVQHLSGAYRDLEDRVQERTVELERERNLLRALMDHHPDVIYFKDVESRFLLISRTLVRKLNLNDSAAAIGKTDLDFFPAEYARQALEDEQRMIRSRIALIGKEEHPTWPDGTQSWVSTTKTCLVGPDGQVLGTFGISHDISEQKQAQEALEQREQQTRLIIDTANDAFVAMDSQGRITDWNAEAERTFGWSRDEALGRLLAETIIPPRYREAHFQGLRQFLETGTGKVLNTRIEITGLNRHGREFPIELTISPLRVRDTYVFNAFIHDITRRKQDEAAIREAKEAAERANRAKSIFLATMSHEIRTPMNAIIGLTELVLDTPLSAQQRESLKLVQESGDALLSLINDVLDFSKIEADRVVLEHVPFELRETLGDTMKTLAVRAHGKGLELSCRISPDVPEILAGDRVRLGQVVTNLVGNAIKFTHDGEIVLSVECEDLDDELATLHYTVRDTGIGVPDDRQQMIFEAFQQAESSTTRQFGGTGLGLAICARLVELMGGRIWVESDVGHGSTFHFTARVAISKNKLPPAPSRTAGRLQGLRVLVVDDNETNRRILKEVLTNWRMRPTVVGSAREALAALASAREGGQSFELVLTDCHMPGVDGFSLVEQIREDPTLLNEVVMMLTSDDSPEGIARCEALGISAYLTKPVKQSELFDAIVAVLNNTSAEESPHEPRPARALRSLRILLAEDSFLNQKVAIGLLERYGHAVEVANNGREAVAAVQQDPSFDLVLMDVQMPEMDGLEATETIRQWEGKTGGHVPIIAMTANAMKGDRERCLAAGMDDYVSKPVRSHELFAAIERALPSRGTPRAGDVAPPENPPASGSQAINWQAAWESVGGDGALLKDLIQAFMEEAPRRVEEIRRALVEQEAKTVQREAHTLKSNTRLLGAAESQPLAQRLEEIGASGDLSEAAGVFAELEQALDRLIPVLVKYLEESEK